MLEFVHKSNKICNILLVLGVSVSVLASASASGEDLYLRTFIKLSKKNSAAYKATRICGFAEAKEKQKKKKSRIVRKISNKLEFFSKNPPAYGRSIS